MNENEYSIVIVMCLSLFLIYMINNTNNKLSKLKNNDNNDNNNIVFEDNIDYKIKEVDNENNIFNEMIKYNHSMCPIMDSYSKMSACVHYPPLNRGFIVSTCCKHCIEKIQTSFKTADNIYTVKKDNNEYYLYKNNTKTQLLLECSIANMELITSLVGTSIME
jgi:hypothetical protein